MDSQRIYNELINRAKERGCVDGYSEKHHILPKSLGGSDNLDNLVELTAREHYLAHWLLYEIYKDTEYTEMTYAFHMMCTTRKGLRVSSRAFEECKKRKSEDSSRKLKGKKPHINTAIGASIKNRGENNPAKRPDVRKKMSESRKGYKQSKETIAKSAKSRTGLKMSREACRKTQLSQSSRVVAYEYNNNKVIVFQCVSDCAKHYNLHSRNLRKYIQLNKMLSKGRCENMRFEYV